MASTQAEIQVQINWNNYIELVAIVIPYYDFLLTFGDEVELFWQYPSRSFVTILFYVNRYLALLGNVPILYFRFLPKQAKGSVSIKTLVTVLLIYFRSCQGIVLYNQFFMSIIQLITSTFFVVRVYAIYERNKKILAILILAITAMVVNALVQISSTQISKADTMDYAVGCSQRYSEDQGHHLAYAWLGAALVDLLVFILTFKRTVKLKKIYKRTGLWDLVMRDGIIYFAVITIFNSSNILVFVVTKVGCEHVLLFLHHFMTVF
ncbi:hypothetical protein K435DRAFT_482730 [Dendrothele bispora CBS 962.96]|uniref:DUF6533 domain-containing protein n=1 Tax=Dendrothele bispora (strain CBS 962.96) TaxID=1314807 RepID=A0A4S8MTL5_DENBC|nr:hypothetical protein K435DRAFT_482730 [Dendrothele bispora CBS 962.96]